MSGTVTFGHSGIWCSAAGLLNPFPVLPSFWIIWQATKKLELFPKSHQDRLVGRYAGKGYKQLIIDNYIAIFKVDENKKKVFVLTVQYQGRQM